MAACGIDVGSLSAGSLSYVAWLDDGEFLLDVFVPSSAEPLPRPPARLWGSHDALDAPQGLAAVGERRRQADREARTPTSVLPPTRAGLATSKLYRAFIEAGIEIFWSLHESGEAAIVGLDGPARENVVMETYPRYVIKRLWPELTIPSKRKTPRDYIDAVWPRIRGSGLSCGSVIRPNVDQVDAMLCALAADAYDRAGGLPSGAVGLPPSVDATERVIREGFIVAP